MIGFLILFIVLSAGVIVYDLQQRRIPNQLNICFFISFLAYFWAEKLSLFSSLFAIVIVLTIFLFIYGVTHGGLGEGDIKLVVSLAGILGVFNLLNFLLLASLLTLPFALFFYKKKNHMEYEIPFGPFLIISFLIIFVSSNLQKLF